MNIPKIQNTYPNIFINKPKNDKNTAHKDSLSYHNSGLEYLENKANSIRFGNNIKSNTFLINDDDTLFPWENKKAELSMEEISQDSLVLVHMTNFYPNNGKIISTKEGTKDKDGVSEYRSTIHFALNKAVSEHQAGNAWNTMNYAIIAPFKETVDINPKSKVLGGITDDFSFQDEVILPKGSVILKYNENIPETKLKVSDIYADGKKLEGMKLIETSNKNMGETATRIVKKMGYSTMVDFFAKESGLTEEDYNLLTNPPKELTPELMEKLVDISMSSKTSETVNKINQLWKEFTSKNNYSSLMAMALPQHRSEMVIQGIDLLAQNMNDWQGADYEDNEVDYRKEFCKVLDECAEMLPEGKSFSFDVNALKKIIQGSNNPQTAKQRIKNELKLISLPPREENPEPIETKEKMYCILDMILLLSDIQKITMGLNTD